MKTRHPSVRGTNFAWRRGRKDNIGTLRRPAATPSENLKVNRMITTRLINVLRPSLIAIALTATTATVPALANTWLGGAGNWSDAAKWSTGLPTGTDAVRIDDGDPGNSDVALDVSAAIASLTLDAGDSLTQLNSFDLTLTAGAVNNGVWSMAGTSSDTFLQFSGDQTLSGSGELILGNDPQNRIITSNSTFTNGAGHTIRGGGQILNNSGGFINEGSVIADGTMVIDPNDLGLTNNGIMRATGGGTLTLLNGTVTNNSTIEAQDNSQLVINASTLNGGTLMTSGTGKVALLNASTLSGVTLSAGSLMSQANGEDVNIAGGITNNGTWQLNGTSADTFVQFLGDQIIGGTGEIVLNNDPQSRIITNNTVVTNGAGHTIRGGGQLLNNTGGMINEGTLLADGPLALSIDPNGLGFTNTGTMRATGSGGFSFLTGAFDNTASSIDIETGSSLDVGNGVELIGGTLNTSGTGVVNLKSLSTLNGVTSNGTMRMANGDDVNIVNGITNNGTWEMNGTSSDTFVQFVGAQTLGGTGELVLGNDPQNRVTTDATVFTNGVGHTIRGGGQLLNNTGGMINNGTIVADGTQQLAIDPDGNGFTNNGTMLATGSGGFSFLTGTFDNTASSIDVADGSNLTLQNGATLKGGALNTTGTGVVNIRSLSVLDGVTNNGTMRMANGDDVNIVNGITNNGTWEMNGTSSDTFVQFVGAQTLGGTGELVLGNDPQNRVTTTATVVTNGVAHTIRGGGQLLNNTGGMINNGTIVADGTQQLAIDPDGNGFTNNGTMLATGSGGFSFLTGIFDNTASSIDVADGSNLTLQDGATLKGGALNTTGTGVVNLRSLSVLDGVTSNGRMVMANGADVNVVNGVTNNGTWEMNGTSSDTFAQFLGAQTIGGTGELILGNDSQNRIITDGSTIANGAGHTIRGGGLLLNNTGSMTNFGTIIADGGPGISIDADATGFLNAAGGQMQALGIAGIEILTGGFSNAGDVLIAAGSRLRRTGDYTQTAGSTHVNGTLTLTSPTTSIVDLQGGTLDGNGLIEGDVLNGGGVIAAGMADGETGTLTIEGMFTQSATGTMLVEIGGSDQGVSYDLISVIGNDATIDGTLEVSFVDGFAPVIGESFDILTAVNVIGEFGDTLLPVLGNLTLEIQYLADRVRLTTTVVPVPAALWLFGSAAFGLLGFARRQRSN
jgi:hypothetical protein